MRTLIRDVGHRWFVAGNEHNVDGIQPDGRRLDVMLTHPYRGQLPHRSGRIFGM
jgi:hypothetical protein